MGTAGKVEVGSAPTKRLRSIPQAAKDLGKSHQSVYVLALKGELEFEIVEEVDRVFIHEHSIAAYKARKAEAER